MREILFRGKSDIHTDRRWVYGVPVPVVLNGYLTDRIDMVHTHSYDEDDLFSLCSDDTPVDPKTIGEYSGLNDQYGVKKFEGDIFRLEGNGSLYKVIFEGCRWMIEGVSKERYGIRLRLWPGIADAGEVVGNIYDNPEMIYRWED